MKKRRNDLLLVGLLLGVSLIFLLVMLAMRRGGSQVVIYKEGKREAAFPLSEDRSYLIGSANGTNLLVVRDGEAFLEDADCPDQLCVHMGAIRFDGQTIVCLPHKVIVAIEGGEKESASGEEEIDIVVK